MILVFYIIVAIQGDVECDFTNFSRCGYLDVSPGVYRWMREDIENDQHGNLETV
mgnify:CR=1 FL=1